MGSRTNPWDGTGPGRDPDDHYDTWHSVEQGIIREDATYTEEPGAEPSLAAFEERKDQGTSGTGLDRGYNPGKSRIRQRQTLREAVQDPWRTDVQPLSF